ncbi:MAG: biopolymer transporter ExbD [Bacteroidales bacterium]|jgi:biopolymer transport protein ExbD|nr:biopolymer transporter ExbD [Bacteroidales bacterium]
MALRSRNKVSAAFNMSSMTDIVFLLLIFFMVTSTLIAPNALKLLLPKSAHQTSANVITTISINKELSFFIETQQVPFEDIEGILKNKFSLENITEPAISLHAEKSVPIEEVTKVLSMAKDNSWKLILATSAK